MQNLTTRNLTVILSIIAGFLLVLVVLLLISWRLFATSTPAPTPTLLFMTVTPTPTPMVLTPSPTVIPSPIPTATPIPTSTGPVIPSPTPTNTPTPHAIINGPGGFVNVRSGPGPVYDPPLGTYNNDTVVDVIGKQYSSGGELWWLIDFPAGPYGQGWVSADFVIARNVDDVS